MILIITFPDNQHVSRVTEHLRSDYELLDMAWFPSSVSLSAYAGVNDNNTLLRLPSGREICLEKIGAVWRRRISPFGIDPILTDQTSKTFAWSETTEAVDGLWSGMNCFWMNRPEADERAQKKCFQHKIAVEEGLRIPETLVTNNPDHARAFIEKHSDTGVIRKAFRNIPQAPRTTLVIGHEEMAHLDSVRLAPVIFQEFIPVDLDLRVTVIDGEIFTTAFKSDPEFASDYRTGIGTAKVSSFDLPPQVQEKLLALMRRLNLNFGAVDFRLTPDGEYVFFEVNPAGEYLFCSERTGQPIPAAIAAALERQNQAFTD